MFVLSPINNGAVLFQNMTRSFSRNNLAEQSQQHLMALDNFMLLRVFLEHSRTAETSAQKCSKPDIQRIRGFLKWYALYKSTFYLLTYLLINLKISNILWGGAQPIPRPSPDQGLKPFFVPRRTSCYTGEGRLAQWGRTKFEFYICWLLWCKDVTTPIHILALFV